MSDTYEPRRFGSGNKIATKPFQTSTVPLLVLSKKKELPIGKHPLQLYSLGTPNGVKVTIMLEELLALGHSGAEYDAWLVNIRDGSQFGSGFVAANPNSKIPALVDHTEEMPSECLNQALFFFT